MAKYKVEVQYTDREGWPGYEDGTLDENGYFARQGQAMVRPELNSCKLATAGPVQRGANVTVVSLDPYETANVARIVESNGINAKVDRGYTAGID
jgi:hypothetical protein